MKLSGIDGINPIGFFTALGVLSAGDPTWRLSWVFDQKWTPVLHGVDDMDEVVACLFEDLSVWRDLIKHETGDEPIEGDDVSLVNPIDPEFRDLPLFATEAKSTADVFVDSPLNLGYWDARYNKEREVTAKTWKYDLRPPLSVYRRILENAQRRNQRERDADFFVAFGSEVVSDNKGNTKPTALHFTSGPQLFIKPVRDWLIGSQRGSEITETHIRSALTEVWTKQSKHNSLGWDMSKSARIYALRANDPGRDSALTELGAEWLAFRALNFFPTAPSGKRLETTLCRGYAGSSQTPREMTWPLWSPSVSRDELRSLFHKDITRLTESERRALGVEAVFTSRVVESGKGYGSFAPSRELAPYTG